MPLLYALAPPPSADAPWFQIGDEWIGLPADCPCGRLRRQRHFPAKLYFSSGTPLEFNHVGFNMFFPMTEVCATLARDICGLECRDVEIAQAGKEGPTHEFDSKAYRGSALCEMWFTHTVPWNPTKSTLELHSRCEIHDFDYYVVEGIEIDEFTASVRNLPVTPRKPGAGVLLASSELKGCDFFRFGYVEPDYDVGIKMCTETAKRYIEEKGWRGIRFVEAGEIVE